MLEKLKLGNNNLRLTV